MGLASKKTPIEGLLVFQLEVHGDNRGWFKENWRKNEFSTLGLKSFSPVQQNMSFNAQAGSTRGFHAEPWNKLISVSEGLVFGAFVDLREGEGFGQTWTLQLDPWTSVFVPSGVANSYQTLTDGATYSYLVDGYWRVDDSYTMLNLKDESIAINWPIPLDNAVLSVKDLGHPLLREITPLNRKPNSLIFGATGQVGKAISLLFENSQGFTRDELDFAETESIRQVSLRDVDLIFNAAAYTNVDLAEQEAGKQLCWEVNVDGVSALVEKCHGTDITFVHFSSDYVFDGAGNLPYDENSSPGPLNHYGLTKLLGDKIVSTLPKHYILRTSWVVGDGHNFVRTMMKCALESKRVMVVDDQFGRLTFASDLARTAKYLVESNAPYGTYNVTSSGPLLSWHEIARIIYSLVGADTELVVPTTTSEYGKGKTLANRPRNSDLCTTKLAKLGFEVTDQITGLTNYVIESLPNDFKGESRQAAE